MKDNFHLSTVNSQLPKGWEIKKLGDVCEVQRGLTYSGKDAVDHSNIIVLRATNIDLKSSSLDFTELKYLRDDFIIKEKYRLRKDSLLICFSSGSKSHLGKVALVDDNYDYAFGGFIGQINPNEEINSKYLFYSLISENYKQYISELTDGLNINNLKIKDLQDFQIPIPPLLEQQRIVEILDKAFVAIDKVKQNAEQNLRNAKEVFQSKLQSIFDNGKLKVENGEWEKHTLKQVCEITSKLVDPKESQYQDMIHIGAGNIVAENGALIDLKTAREEELISGKFVFDNSMVLYSKIRPYLMKIVKCDFKGLCSADIYPLNPLKDKITKSFLYYLLYSSEFTRYAIEGSQRAGMPKVNRSHLFNYSFYCPSLTEQEQLAQSLDNLSVEIDNLAAIYQQKLANLDELKKSILQKAFRGEL